MPTCATGPCVRGCRKLQMQLYMHHLTYFRLKRTSQRAVRLRGTSFVACQMALYNAWD